MVDPYVADTCTASGDFGLGAYSAEVADWTNSATPPLRLRTTASKLATRIVNLDKLQRPIEVPLPLQAARARSLSVAR
ncbi:hypothetical protein KEM52_002839 [Ascosphaera acerosa]|nr:hypothetical protein KEM52_002839 [Ascosphaera acerosa]